MNIVAYDTETFLMRPGCMAPEIVCLSWQRVSGGNRFDADIVHAAMNPQATLELVTSWLTTDTLIVGHHVAFDMAVLCARWPHLVPLVFKAYAENRVTCTKVRQQLLDIAAGEFRGRLQRFEKEVELTEEDLKDLVEAGATIPEGGVKRVQGARWIPHNYDLDAVGYRATGRRLSKGADSWRLRYGELVDTPIAQWPREAVDYPLEDARTTLDVFLSQEVHVEYMEDQFRQVYAAWALHLTSVWGLRTHGPGVDALERETLIALGEIEDGLKDAGLVRRGGYIETVGKNGKVRKKSAGKEGSRDTKAAKRRMVEVCEAQGKPIRLTNKGVGICLDSDACEASEDDILQDYSELTALKAMLSKDIPVLRSGIVYPVHTSYGLAASGRSTSSKPNVQNPKRSNKVMRNGVLKYQLPDVREIWAPRNGYIYAQADFSSMELCTLAQCCMTLFGQSELAKILNAGRDPLTEFAVTLLPGNVTYEEGIARKKDKSDKEFDNARQTAKVAMYGMPGGLGPSTLIVYARKSYQLTITEERAKILKIQWFERFPEMRLFFDYCGSLIDSDTGLGTMLLPLSRRWRGGTHYTGICNSWFQGWASDCAKRALCLVQHACFAEPENVLYNSRPVLFVHDEIVTEVLDDDRAHDKAVEQARLMVQGANEFLPDVPVRAEPQLMTVWSKNAMDVYDQGGRLVPWDPGMEARKALVYDKKGTPIVWKAA